MDGWGRKSRIMGGVRTLAMSRYRIERNEKMFKLSLGLYSDFDVTSVF